MEASKAQKMTKAVPKTWIVRNRISPYMISAGVAAYEAWADRLGQQEVGGAENLACEIYAAMEEERIHYERAALSGPVVEEADKS